MAALADDIIPERYSRNQKTLGCAEQRLLLGSHVAIIGQGGLGGAVTEILARIGVGKLTLVDGDVFEESNLNRQLLSTIADLGRAKAAVGRERVLAVNPAVEVNAVAEFLTAANRRSILAGVQVAVDCLDAIPARFTLLEGCREAGIPLVSAAIAGSAGQALVLFPEDQGFELIYGAAASAPSKGAETALGTLPYAAVSLAAIESAEVVSLLVTGSTSLRKKVLMVNLEQKEFEKVILP